MKKFPAVMAAVFLMSFLAGCGVSREQYNEVLAERDALRSELEALREEAETPDAARVKISGSFTATVRVLIPDYILDDTSPRVAVVTLFQSNPFALFVGDLGGELEAGETYVFEIETKENAEITEGEYGYLQPETDIARYNLRISGVRIAGEEDYGLESNHLVFEAY